MNLKGLSTSELWRRLIRGDGAIRDEAEYERHEDEAWGRSERKRVRWQRYQRRMARRKR